MTNNVSDGFLSKGTYLGYFEVETHTTNKDKDDKPSQSYERLVFHRALNIERRDLIAMGDIVYGMYVEDDSYNLTKIGMAGGAKGWASRAYQYSHDPANDKTNRKILKHLREDFATKNPKVFVYGLSVPRIKTTYFCPITNETVDIEVSQNGAVETHLIAVAEEQGENLIFCRQKT